MQPNPLGAARDVSRDDGGAEKDFYFSTKYSRGVRFPVPHTHTALDDKVSRSSTETHTSPLNPHQRTGSEPFNRTEFTSAMGKYARSCFLSLSQDLDSDPLSSTGGFLLGSPHPPDGHLDPSTNSGAGGGWGGGSRRALMCD